MENSHSHDLVHHDLDAIMQEGPAEVAEGFPVSSLLDALPDTQHNQLLEMLHVPLIHGGVRETFLHPTFTTYSEGSFALACILLALVSCVLELLRLVLWWLEGRFLSEAGTGTSSCTCKQCCFPVLSLAGDRKNYNTIHNVQQVDPNSDTQSVTTTKKGSFSWLSRCVTTVGISLLNMLTYQGSTLLMLVAMTMNIFLIISLGIGATCGKMISLLVKKHLQEARKHH